MKETRTAAESHRIAGTKVKQALGKIALMTDDMVHSNDHRISPRCYAPIIIERGNQTIMVPARYLLRQPGKPAFMDDRLSGNYNGRRNNLTKFWRNEFGTKHVVLAVTTFYENVLGPDDQNVVLHFNTREPGVMLIAYLHAEWSDPNTGDTLLSFAAVTDDPLQEVAAAVHDRMVIRLTREIVGRRLTPQDRSEEELLAILSEFQPAYYAHTVAA